MSLTTGLKRLLASMCRPSLQVTLVVLGAWSALGCVAKDHNRPQQHDPGGDSIEIAGMVVRSTKAQVQVLSRAPGPALALGPIAGASVVLRNAYGQESSATTDETGRFHVGPVKIAGLPGDVLLVSAGTRFKGLELTDLSIGGMPDFKVGKNELYVALPTPACEQPATDSGTRGQKEHK